MDASQAGPRLPRFMIVRGKGEGASAEVVRAIGGRVRRGDRVSVAINPCDHSHYALVLINDGKVVVPISGTEGEIGAGGLNALVLRYSDGSEWPLVDGARVVALFSNTPIANETASAMALRDDFRPDGIDFESETLNFDL